MVSAGFTLAIFGVWSVVTFSLLKGDEKVATNENLFDSGNTASVSNAAAPFDTITSGIEESVQSLKEQYNVIKGSIKSVDLNAEYENMRSGALNSSSQNTNNVDSSVYGN